LSVSLHALLQKALLIPSLVRDFLEVRSDGPKIGHIHVEADGGCGSSVRIVEAMDVLWAGRPSEKTGFLSWREHPGNLDQRSGRDPISSAARQPTAQTD
jgi:hypothetical protein